MTQTYTSKKRKPKCLICMEIARQESLVRPITKAYMYQLIREGCTHLEEERKSGIENSK